MEAGGGGGGSTVTWGTESGGYVPLTVEGVSKSYGVSTHITARMHGIHIITAEYEPVFTKTRHLTRNSERHPLP